MGIMHLLGKGKWKGMRNVITHLWYRWKDERRKEGRPIRKKGNICSKATNGNR
jgi:hypothetical protein